MASATSAPYTTITAYHLNTGEIKWQVANGDDPQTLRAGGPGGTGGQAARAGMVVVKGGIVFQGGNDGKFRAYDEDTGKELWFGLLPGGTSGVPAGFEAKGRQYIAVIAAGGGGRGGGGAAAPAGAAGAPGAAVAAAPAPAPAQNPNQPRGVIAFALPDNGAPAKK